MPCAVQLQDFPNMDAWASHLLAATAHLPTDTLTSSAMAEIAAKNIANPIVDAVGDLQSEVKSLRLVILGTLNTSPAAA